jgi:type IV secretion system protein VirB4
MGPAAYFRVIGPWGDTPYVLTHDGWLLAFLEHSGRDPDGRSAADFDASLLTALNARGNLPREVSVQEYLLHAQDQAPTPRVRKSDVANRLLANRTSHLQTKHLSRTRLLTVIAIQTEAMSRQVSFVDMVTWALAAPFDSNSRARLKRVFSLSSSHRFLRSAIDHAATRLRDVIQTYIDRLSIHDLHRQLSIQEAWTWCSVLATTDAGLFYNPTPAPADDWYLILSRADQRVVHHDGLDYWLDGNSGTYARMASISRFDERTQPAFWVRNKPPITGAPGNFLCAINATRLTPLREAMAWKLANDGVDRARLNLGKMFLSLIGTNKGEAVDADPVLARQAQELRDAQALGEAWWDVSISLMAFDRSPANARTTAMAIDNACSQAGVTATWESPLVIDAHRSMQPGAKPLPPRTHLLNTAQCAAVGLLWSHSQGERAVKDLGGEEPLYYLETRDGQLFGFSPFVGEKSGVLGVGPTRSGKTFLKNAILSHLPKYDDSCLVSYDYDPGSECLAHLYRDDAALFRGAHGLNPFTSFRPGLTTFRPHFSRLIAAMLASNSDPAMQRMDDGDQAALDAALNAILQLPTQLRTLSTFAEHLPKRLRDKLSRWVRGGDARYADLMDAQSDRIGLIERAVTVFSVPELRDDIAGRIPVATEILYRTATAFEDPSRRNQIKVMTLDEAHLALKDPQFARFLSEKARTWAKFRASLWLLTQQPHELLAVQDWEAIRTAASTYFFTAAPEIDRSAYREAFGLTDADMTEISQLVPKREVYLVQPETGLRKVLILDPDAYTRTFASSTAHVVAERDARIEREGFDAAMTSTLSAISR